MGSANLPGAQGVSSSARCRRQWEPAAIKISPGHNELFAGLPSAVSDDEMLLSNHRAPVFPGQRVYAWWILPGLVAKARAAAARRGRELSSRGADGEGAVDISKKA